MNRTPFALIALLLGLLLVGCATQTPITPAPETSTPTPTATALPPRPVIPYTPVPSDLLSPIVVQRSPERGEVLDPDGAIELVFDKPMDPEAVSAAFALQLAGSEQPVAGDLTWVDDRSVRFMPAKPLARNSAYDVVLTQNASAESGEPLREPFTFRFSTAGYLEVAQVMPAPDTSDVETAATITVIFSRPVVPLTTLQQMESLPHPLVFEPAIEGKGEWLNTSIYVFTPAQPLAGGVTYRAQVAAGLQDVSGAVLANDYIWQFTTIPPRVLWVEPADAATLVDINTPIRVTFNQPVDLQSARQAFSLRSEAVVMSRVNGTFALIDDTLVFTPSSSLSFESRYVVELESGVTSAGGGTGMLEPFRSSFTTVPLPEIVETYPRDQERNASPHTEFGIRFNTHIDPATVMPNLRMTPPLSPTLVYTYYSSYDQTFHLSFGAQASTDYEVVIGDGIADPYGNRIPRGMTVRFRTAPLDPTYRLHVPEGVGTYDAAQPARILLAHINVNRVDLQLYRLPLDALQRSYWEWRDRLPTDAQLLREWRKSLESPLNKQSYTWLDLTEIEGGTLEPGVYLLDATSADIQKDQWLQHQQHLLVVSALNLTLKAGTDSGLVWATDLGTGLPVSDLSLKIAQMYTAASLGQATTGIDGVARFSIPRDRGSVVAYSESPFAAASTDWASGISPWDFGMGEGLYEQAYRTYIYTDRPIYRPGQAIHFKGVVRAEDDAAYALPGVRSVRVNVRNPNYEEIYTQELVLSELGAFEGTFELEDGANLGTYVISVSFGDHYTESYVQVSAYRAPEFELEVALQGAEAQRGDTVRAVVTASYYFGGPLADRDLTWSVLAERYSFKPSWGGAYTFDDVDDPYTCFDCWWWWREEPVKAPIMSGTGRTDANGQFTVELDGAQLREALPYRASRIIVEATITGPDNQPISGRGSTVVHPGSYYIGLAPQQYVSDAGRESKIDVVAVDWTGKRLPQTELRVSFYEYEWVNTYLPNEIGGGRWIWDTKETYITSVAVTTDGLGEAVATFVPPRGGSYHVVAAAANPTLTTADIRSSTFIWVAGDNQVSWRRENHDRITLVSDRTTYEVGEIAEILIPSPFEGTQMALVTVERAGIRSHEVLRLESNSFVYRLPITGDAIPNIYVSVVLIKPRGDGLAEFKMGLLPLDIRPAPKTLTLQLEPSTLQAQPGEELSFVLTASLPDGQPAAGAELSLDLVDKAVLSLLPRSQDILSSLYARRALQVMTSSSLSISANRYMEEIAQDLEQHQMAGDMAFAEEAVVEVEKQAEPTEAPMMAPMPTAAGLRDAAQAQQDEGFAPPAGVEIREEFSDTAFWAPLIIMDAQGRASVTVKLPDNLTTWVMRGVGLTAQTVVGEASSEVVAAKPLMVRPVAPRFFVVDDRAQLAANVSNTTDRELQVEVGLSGEGIWIDETTPTRQTIAIPARSEAKVTWWVTVKDVKETQLIFSAVSGDYSDASKPRLTTGPDGSLMVLRYTAPDIVGTAGQLTEGGSRTEAIALPPTFDDRRGSLTVQLDPSLAAGMQDGLAYLEHYEYECTEQTVSRFLPNILTYRALRSLGIENPKLAERLPGLIQTGLDKLYLQQNPDGGWGWWHDPEAYRSNSHISAYVVFALVKARQAGFEVKEAVLANGIAYLTSQLQAVKDYRDYRSANHQAWLLYVLTEAGSVEYGRLETLYTNREKLSHYGRAYLAQSLWLLDADDARLKTLLSDLNNAAILSATGAHWEEQGYDWWAMNTDTRSTAIILDTLAKLDPQNELVPNVVRWLMVARRAGIWETTQETAWALIALTDWMVETGELDASYEYAYYLNDQEQMRGSATRATVRDSIRQVIPITDLLAEATNVLTIARTDGNGRLYYTAHLEVYLPVEQIEPADRGFSVTRRYTLASCQEPNRLSCPEVREVRLGDVIRVDLTIITPHDRYYVVVEDPLPAGGEAIDTGLATTSLLAMDPTLRLEGSRYWWWWHWYSRSELRDEKVVLFADYLSAGTYEYSYTFRATLPGDYHVIPTVAKEFYFPEVFGRSDGRLLTIGQ